MSDSAASWMPAMVRPMYVGGGSLGRYLADGEGLEGAYLEAGGHPLVMATYGRGGSPVGARLVAPEALDLLAAGVDPGTGARLRTMRAGSVGSFDQALTIPRELAVAAVCWPDVRRALDGAMVRAMEATRDMVAAEMRVKVGPRGRQTLVRPDEVMVVTARHETSRAGDPHPHWHMVVVSQARLGDRWYAVDSDRLFKLHGRMQGVWGTALYADRALRDALAAHHLELGADGSLPELAAEAEVLGKRARQIEARIGELTEAWREREGAPAGAVPPAPVRGRIKRQAWAETRRAKTAETTRVDWEGWYGQLLASGLDPRARMAALGPLPARREPSVDAGVADALAGRAVARLSAARSAWSRDDVDAMAWTMVRELGVAGSPAMVGGVHDMIMRAALGRCEELSDHPAARQAWVRSLTSRQVIEESEDLAGRLATRAASPLRVMDPEDTDLLEGLDPGQAEAVRAIIAGDGIVEGAAGAGKTHMLGRVVAWHDRHHVGLRILTPTLQAAQAAAEETGAAATTVDGLLWAYGWRRDPGTGAWRQLALGEEYALPDGGTATYRGVPEGLALPRHGTLVVDEAGMVSADRARILYELADRAGCRVALVGDSRQLAQIGRGGLMDLAHDWLPGPQQVEMDILHRFRDEAYGRWTLRVRACQPGQARAIAGEMMARGMVRVHSTDGDTAAAIAATWSPRTTLMASTNAQVDQINSLVQARRIMAGDLPADGPAVPSMVDGETIRPGDIIQTRRNDKGKGVANRMRWRVREARADGGLLVQDPRTHRDVDLPAAYVREHVQLGYASTAHGAQGATAEKGAAWVGERTDRAGLYVTITRGKGDNIVHVTAADEAEAIDLLAAALRRDNADRGLDAAKAALAAQIADAPAPATAPQTQTTPQAGPVAEASRPVPPPMPPRPAPPEALPASQERRTGPAGEPLDDRRARHLAVMDRWARGDGLAGAWRSEVADGQAAAGELDQVRAERGQVAQALAERTPEAAEARDAWEAALDHHRLAVGAQVTSLETERGRVRAQVAGLYAKQAETDRERLRDLRGRIQRLEEWEDVWRLQEWTTGFGSGWSKVEVTTPPRGRAAEETRPADGTIRHVRWKKAQGKLERMREDAGSRAGMLRDAELDILGHWPHRPKGYPDQSSVEARADADPDVTGLDRLIAQARKVLDEGPLDPGSQALRQRAARLEAGLADLRGRLDALDRRAAGLEARAERGRAAATRVATLTDGTPADRYELLDAHYRPSETAAWERDRTDHLPVERRWSRLAEALDDHPDAPIWDTRVEPPDGTGEALGDLVWRLTPTSATDGWDAMDYAHARAGIHDRARLDTALIDALDRTTIGTDDPDGARIRAQALEGTHADPATWSMPPLPEYDMQGNPVDTDNHLRTQFDPEPPRRHGPSL